MSSITLYFGAPATKDKSASVEAKALNLNLLRAAPSEINPVTTLEYVQPGHSVYKDFMGVFIKSATTRCRLSSRNPPYHLLQTKTVDSTVLYPSLIWSYNQKLNTDQIAELQNKVGASETKANNKQAFEMNITQQNFTDLRSLSITPNAYTPPGTRHVNISGFQIYLFLHRLYDAFCRTNQYPGFKTNDRADVGWSKLCLMMDGTEKVTKSSYKENDGVTDVDIQTVDANYPDANFLIYANTTVKFEDMQYEYEFDADFPTGFTYLLLPYTPILTKTDYSVVTRVVQRYFMGCLGNTAEQSASLFLDIKSAWGNLCKTSWGDILAHKYRCIELCLLTQTSLRLLKSNNVYRGGILVGGMYTLRFNDVKYIPGSRDEILEAVKNASPHAASLKYIYSKLHINSPTEMVNKRNACQSLNDLNKDIRHYGFIEAERAEIVRRSYHLNFPGTNTFLAPTAYNISKIFEAIGDSSIVTVYPLHPEAVTSINREERLLSAFGTGVPTFLVANGKKMSLEGSFSIREKEKGSSTSSSRAINKIACTLVPLKIAYQDFLQMKEGRFVLNPFGAQIANSKANTAIVRTFEKESADMILVSLRKSVGASAVIVDPKKRKADDEDINENEAKKGALEFF